MSPAGVRKSECNSSCDLNRSQKSQQTSLMLTISGGEREQSPQTPRGEEMMEISDRHNFGWMPMNVLLCHLPIALRLSVECVAMRSRKLSRTVP